jgi:predicted permease
LNANHVTVILDSIFPVFVLIISGVVLKRFKILTDDFLKRLDRLIHFIFFTLPTSTAAYYLSSRLHSDSRLASAAILLSTLFSLVSLSAALAMLAS